MFLTLEKTAMWSSVSLAWKEMEFIVEESYRDVYLDSEAIVGNNQSQSLPWDRGGKHFTVKGTRVLKKHLL